MSYVNNGLHIHDQIHCGDIVASLRRRFGWAVEGVDGVRLHTETRS